MRERRFLIDPSDFGEGRALVRGAELHHMTRVLRLRPGDEIAVFDGRGAGFRGRIESLDAAQAVIALAEPEDPAVEPRCRITLLQGIPHGERMDLIVEKATELGASRIVPVVSERTVVRPRRQGWGRLDRWRRIAVSAAKQSGRLVVPEIPEPVEFEGAVGFAGGEGGSRFIFHTSQGEAAPADRLVAAGSPARQTSEPSREMLILIGPEGGFTTGEFDAALAAGWQARTLGPRTLRADTAAVAALTLALEEAGEVEPR